MYYKKVLTILFLLCCLVWLAIWQFPDNKTNLIFCNVGQGDALLISKGFNQMLIDGGPDEKVLDCLAKNMPFWDKTLEIVALTHPEADHLTGLISVFDKYQVKYFLAGPEANVSGGYEALRQKVQREENLRIVNSTTGDQIKVGELVFKTLWPEKEWLAGKVDSQDGAVLGAKTEHKKLNDFSLVFLLEMPKAKVLFMGDGDSEIQDDILRYNSLTQIDLLKFPHHGSKTGIREDFLAKIKPKEAVISVGKNSFGHPTSEALELLGKYKVNIRRTDLEGDIEYKF